MSSLNDSNSTSESDNSFVEIKSGDQSDNVADVSIKPSGKYGLETIVNIEEFNGQHSTNFEFEMARGNIAGIEGLHKFGANPEIDNGTEDVWLAGGTYPFPTSAQTTTIKSDNNNDSSGDTGARTCRVFGLDSSFVEITEDVTLNGTSNVTLSNDYLRVFRAAVLTAGSSGANEGDIQVRHGTTVLGQISEGKNQTQMAVYTIPSGKTGYLTNWQAQVASKAGSTGTKQALVSLRTREENSVFRIRDERASRSDISGDVVKRDIYLVLEEKTDLKISCEVFQTNTRVSGSFEIILEDN